MLEEGTLGEGSGGGGKRKGEMGVHPSGPQEREEEQRVSGKEDGSVCRFVTTGHKPPVRNQPSSTTLLRPTTNFGSN